MMEEQENKEFKREEIFSRVIRAGKRTYFFDVKATRAGENYLTITESKRRFNNDQGKFFYEKHKVFLYKEDFEKFLGGLNDVVHFIDSGEEPPERITEESQDQGGSQGTMAVAGEEAAIEPEAELNQDTVITGEPPESETSVDLVETTGLEKDPHVNVEFEDLGPTDPEEETKKEL